MTLVIRFVKCQTGEKAEIRKHILGFLSGNDINIESLTNLEGHSITLEIKDTITVRL